MTLFDLTLASPAENLACDEALLDLAESWEAGQSLRFWESQQLFVVVGYAEKVAVEVNTAACNARNIPIHRRCSGGGTVLQGPGCLNYSLVLKIDPSGPLQSIVSANRHIMEQNREALQSLISAIPQSAIGNRQSAIAVRGHTDLTLGELKFSGNSQRRRKHYLLFHGTFLLDFNLSLVSELLNMPSKQPTYRHARPHSEFVTNLNLPAQSIKTALIHRWTATQTSNEIPPPQILNPLIEKYASREWNLKF